MGAYGECWLESLYIGSTKNDFDLGLMQLFRASDKRMYKSAVKDLPSPMRRWASYVDNPKEKINVVYYTIPALLIRDRLDLKGYTLATAKRAFMKRMRTEITEYTDEVVEGMKDFYENRARILRALDVDEWVATLRRIKEADRGIPQWATSRFEKEVTLEDFMLQNEWYGFPGVDLYVPLRLALEVCTEKDSFVYDITDLISSGYLDKNEDFVALASEFSASEHASRSRTIVLTEGRSDAWILSESLKLLYPHLCDYFTFMDFEAAKVEGGASHLARIVKSFAGAGIVNKVIAVFDNDTAGQEAIHSLRNVKLPGNLCALKLPDLKRLRKYPTIGLSRPISMNVNGLAASIELYLGDDVLRENGKLAPVKWSAYNPLVGKYQGEVLGKDKIHKRFKEKLAGQRNRAHLTQDPYWSGLCVILSSIFSAFHPYDRKHILQNNRKTTLAGGTKS
jgi:hypothetical protein